MQLMFGNRPFGGCVLFCKESSIRSTNPRTKHDDLVPSQIMNSTLGIELWPPSGVFPRSG